jgi:hypothetical protein
LTVAMGVLCSSLWGSVPAYAHHGRDFLFSQTADLPHPGEFYLIPRQDYVDAGDSEEVEFEPTLLAGVTDWLALEVHSHVAREDGESLEYESTAGAIYFRFTRPEARLRVGMSAEYEFVRLDELRDRIEARLAVSTAPGRSLLAFNVVAEQARDDPAETEWGYSIGLRGGVTDHLGMGLEAQGSLQESQHEVLAGFYLDATSHLTVNLGAGAGLRESEIDLSVRTAMIWRLGSVSSGGKHGSHH